MTSYYRVIFGERHIHAQECFEGGFIGTDFGIDEDLTNHLPDDWRTFNREFIPLYLEGHPNKTRVAAGLACGALWTVSRDIRIGDVVLCRDGTGCYYVGEVTGNYYYAPDGNLPHRRRVSWLNQTIDRASMSDLLKKSSGSSGTVSNVTNYHEEIEALLGGETAPAFIINDATVEDPLAFAMEDHLEEFLVKNWASSELGKKYDIYQVDGEAVGQQYETDTGPIDILAISKDKKTLLVVELKRGRASDVVVGQIMRYMGYAQDVLAEPGQRVKGVVIAFEDDQKIRRALAVAPSIEFYRYQLSFKLVKS